MLDLNLDYGDRNYYFETTIVPEYLFCLIPQTNHSYNIHFLEDTTIFQSRTDICLESSRRTTLEGRGLRLQVPLFSSQCTFFDSPKCPFKKGGASMVKGQAFLKRGGLTLFLFHFFKVYHFYIQTLLYPLQNCVVLHLKKNFFFLSP